MLIQGDCLEVLKTLPDNSVDSVVCDPPYGLSFMGKKWDYDVPQSDVWREVLRVLKPGGHLLSFFGTRTYHRGVVAIEDAGFEIRDQIGWAYGSGFPKSLSVGKAINKLETDEWSKISKAIDNIDQESIMDVWKRNALFATIKLSKKIIEVGINTLKSGFAQDNAVLYFNVLNEQLSAIFAELKSQGLNLISEKHEIIVQENAGQSVIQSQNLVRYAVKLSSDQEAKHLSIFTAECDAKEWLKENTVVNHRVDEALKTLRGNKKYSNEEIISVLCAAITSVLKHTILSQSKTFQNLDIKSQMECVSAINATITEYTAENLISNTVDILKSKAVDKLQGNERESLGMRDTKVGMTNLTNFTTKNRFIEETKGTSPWEGWGTALKPAWEPIAVARKPIGEKSVAENVLKWGTGGINVDGCRVGTEERYNAPAGNKGGGNSLNMSAVGMPQDAEGTTAIGRFPANLIHDGSPEVLSLFPNTKSGKHSEKEKDRKALGMFAGGIATDDNWYGDSGSAARFFYCAKASKRDRNEGCDGLEDKILARSGGAQIAEANGEEYTEGQGIGLNRVMQMKNNHPTVKPTDLMRYLCRLVTPKGGTVLDPFMGSGSTGKAAKLEGFDFIGIEREPEYVKIAEARINAVKPESKLF